jgi:hypothetical protein
MSFASEMGVMTKAFHSELESVETSALLGGDPDGGSLVPGPQIVDSAGVAAGVGGSGDGNGLYVAHASTDAGAMSSKVLRSVVRFLTNSNRDIAQDQEERREERRSRRAALHAMLSTTEADTVVNNSVAAQAAASEMIQASAVDSEHFQLYASNETGLSIIAPPTMAAAAAVLGFSHDSPTLASSDLARLEQPTPLSSAAFLQRPGLVPVTRSEGLGLPPITNPTTACAIEIPDGRVQSAAAKWVEDFLQQAAPRPGFEGGSPGDATSRSDGVCTSDSLRTAPLARPIF